MATDEYIRLHITPLNTSLLTTILPPSILPNARNISYHNIQTFPERAYGYVDLPIMDAEKTKKKLNGSILKGTKVRIETARPQRETVEPEAPKVKKVKGTKRKRDEIPAVYIGERHVKRGWTVPSAKAGKKKMVVKSKYTTNPECLFKTVLPPNVAKASKDAKPEQKKHKKGKEVIVHEFSKTTKYATFLRSSSANGGAKGVAEFMEGKGWVDNKGNVVEAVKEPKSKTKKVDVSPKEAPVDAMDTSGSNSSDKSSDEEDEGTPKADSATKFTKGLELLVDTNGNISDTPEEDSSDDNSSEDGSESECHSTPKMAAEAIKNGSPPSDSDSSSSEEDSEAEKDPSLTKSFKASSTSSPISSDSDSTSTSDSDSDSDSDSEAEASTPANKTSRPQSSSGPPLGLSIKIPPTTTTPLPTTVHPLEAIYKRSKPTASNPIPAPAPSSFSFFGADNDEEENMDTQPQIPLTPYTQRDFEFRGLRSAAPTPDTAHANKRFVWPTDNDDEEEGEDRASSPIRNDGKGKGKEGKGEDESEFQKWFYEHRGDANRAWKKRRKVVGKEKRQRENRKRQERI